MADETFAPFTGPTPFEVMDGTITPTYLMDDDAYNTLILTEMDMIGEWNVCPAGHMDCCEHGSM